MGKKFQRINAIIEEVVFVLTVFLFTFLIQTSAQAAQPQLAAGEFHTLGLKSDGTVVAVGNNVYGERDVSSWSSIAQVASFRWHTLSLKPDGTAVAVGDNSYGQCNVSSWNLKPDDTNSGDKKKIPAGVLNLLFE